MDRSEIADKNLIELAYDGVENQTTHAVLIDFGDHVEWIPRSQIEYWDTQMIIIPEWLAKNKGLI
jgi:hypothetical protein